MTVPGLPASQTEKVHRTLEKIWQRAVLMDSTNQRKQLDWTTSPFKLKSAKKEEDNMQIKQTGLGADIHKKN